MVEEFARRDRDASDRRYDAGNPDVVAARRERLRLTRALLASSGLMPLEGRRVLDIGCGSGGLLRELTAIAGPPLLGLGLDLSAPRIAGAAGSARPSCLHLGVADGGALPVQSESFDLVCQSTMLSSILEPAARRAVAGEMVRVTSARGAILHYDFVWNPLNRATRGVTTGELRALFPGWNIRAFRVTLAPPLARTISRLSPTLARIAAMVPALRSHRLALLRRCF
ncbi:MAG: methyltransferase domain-containing protein [Chloroflexota bacterium]|nr:MAG: methyltransferase domain-containing protein [Chloroflexota bacterium]